MAKTKSLKNQLRSLCARRREGSFSTQSTRRRLLNVIADDLRRLGFRNMRLDSLKQKHVWALVRDWQARDLAVATQKNRMTALRWWASNTRCGEVVAKSNDHYGIDRRTYVAAYSKATELDIEKLAQVTDPYVALSLRLQQAFGLRREEAIKFQVHYADRGDTLRLKANWCKGGRPREVPIHTAAQRALLEEIRQFTGGGPDVSLIPSELRYVDQLHRYEYQTQQSGLSKMHGLRHAYAQDRYLELTGWACPVRGGPSRRELDPAARKTDFEARMQISAELGHGREEITTVYLGR